MSGNFNGRARRVLGWLAKRPKGAKVGPLLALERKINPDTTGAQMGATLVMLMEARKAERSGRMHHYVYAITPFGREALTAANAPKPKASPAKRYTSTLARAPKPESQPAVARKAATQARVVTTTGSIVVGPTPSFRQRLSSEALSADVEAFLRNGGRIQKLAQHETSHPFERLFRDAPKAPRPARKHAATKNRDDEFDDAA